jgi:hypothetical protein
MVVGSSWVNSDFVIAPLASTAAACWRAIVFVILGDNDHIAVGKFLPNNSCRLQSVHARHVDVHQDDLRPQQLGLLDCFHPIPGFAADMPIGLRFNERSCSPFEQLMIIGDQDLHRTHLRLTLQMARLLEFGTNAAEYYALNEDTKPLQCSMDY